MLGRACSDRMRRSGFKVEEGRFRLDIRKKLFTVRMVRHWNRCPREVVNYPSLEAFKARLDGSLPIRLELGVVVGDPARSRALKPDEHCGPFQPWSFYDSVLRFVS